ncbi:competence protein ComG [Caldalkalibacillus thermarum]|uniref:competence type IV pilus minor pilin ComGD n=1 Tax=Caldalkalibacillus thermarum TaxID=296745 RepID=UPI00166D1633|nr:competence type IV pilus minor pilin ComGD [Caldalkalibacillus thermarum]GGK19323.1 competence protein ComG [Caldalkalibacillus thermarum]
MARAKGQFQAGFTLVEMLMVLAIFAIVVTMVIPVYHVPHQHLEMEDFFQQLENDLFLAQQTALTELQHVEVEFNPVNSLYIVRYRYGETIFLRRFPDGVSMSTNFPRNRFHFNRHGHISQGGRLFFYYETPNGTETRTYIFQLASGRYRVE